MYYLTSSCTHTTQKRTPSLFALFLSAEQHDAIPSLRHQNTDDKMLPKLVVNKVKKQEEPFLNEL